MAGSHDDFLEGESGFAEEKENQHRLFQYIERPSARLTRITRLVCSRTGLLLPFSRLCSFMHFL